MSRTRAVDDALDSFYRSLLLALGDHAERGGSAIGAGAVAKAVARQHRIALAEVLPLPRLSRTRTAVVNSGGVTARARVVDNAAAERVGEGAAR